MPTLSNGHVLAITSNHVPMVKDALEVILGKDVKSSHRVEIFARICGYRTWASLKSAFDARGADPLPLAPQIVKADPFIEDLPQELRRRLSRLTPVCILEMVLAGLDLSHDSIFGKVGLEENTTLEDLKKHYEYLKRQGSPSRFSMRPDAVPLLVVSPDNINAIYDAMSEMEPTKAIKRDVFQWVGLRMRLLGNDYFYEWEEAEDLVVGDPTKVATTFKDFTKMVFFSQEDADAFTKQRDKSPAFYGQALTETMCETLRELEYEEGGNFFTLGYYGTTRNDVDDILTGAEPAFFARWGAEMLNVAHSYEKEMLRLTA